MEGRVRQVVATPHNKPLQTDERRVGWRSNQT